MFSRLKNGELITPFSLGVLGALLAIFVAFIRGIENTGVQDAKDYLDSAQNMLQGWQFMSSNPDLFVRTLGLPFMVFLTFLLSQSTSLLTIKLLLALGHGLSTLLMAKIGKQMELRKALWVSGAILFSLDPFLLFATTDIQTESITTLMVLYWAYLFITPQDEPKLRIFHLICFPISGFFAVSVRPNIILPFVLIAFLLYLRWNQFGIRRSWILGSSFLFVCLIVTYEIILTSLYKGFVFLSAQGGVGAVFMCRTELVPQYVGFISPTRNAEINQWVLDHLSSVINGITATNPNLSITDLNGELNKIGLSTCAARPLQSLFVLILKCLALWRPFTVFGAYNFSTFILSLLIWLPLTIIMISFILNKKHSRVNLQLRKYFVVLSIGFTISLLLTPTQIRHRVAFAEPFYWLFFMYFISNALHKRNVRKNLSNSSSHDLGARG